MEQGREVERGVETEAHIVELANVHGLVFGRGGSLVHPVYQVVALAVEGAGRGLQPCCAVARAQLERGVALGFERGVALLGRVVGVEIGERRHAQGLVPAGIQLPGVAGAVAHVDARVEAEAPVEPCVAVGHESGREREAAHDDVVLQKEARVGAVALAGVPAVGAVDGFPSGLVQQLAVGRGADVLLAQVGSHGRLAQQPVGREVEGGSVDVRAVIVFAGLGALLSAGELVVVVVAVPVDHGLQPQRPAPAALAVGQRPHHGAHRGHESARLLILVRKPGRVERVGPIVLRGEARLPAHVGPSALHVALVEGAPLGEGRVGRAAVAPHVAPRELVVGGQRGREVGLGSPAQQGLAAHCAERTALGRHPQTHGAGGPRHDVDGAAEGRRAEDACRAPLEHLDALYV